MLQISHVGLCQYVYHITHARKYKPPTLLIVQLTYLVFKGKSPHIFMNHGGTLKT